MERAELKQKTVTGGLFTVANQVSAVALQIGSTVILARILTPSDFGVIGKVTAFTGLTAILGDLGLSLATIQSKEINQKQLSALFWLNVIIGFALAVCIAGSAPLIAWFYDDQRLVIVTLLFAALIFLNGLVVQHKAILKRNLNFAPIFISTFSGGCIGLVLAVIFARQLGYYAIVMQLIITSLFSGIGYWILCGWSPSFHLRGTGIRPMLGMAGNFTGWNLLGYGIRNIDNVLIGKFEGDQQLAFYTKAYGLVLQPLLQISVPISQVAVPALSKLQSEPEAYRSFFCKGCSIAMILQLPIAIFSVVAAPEIVLTLLGSQWQPSVPIFLALSPALLSAATSPATSWIYLSRGDTKRMMRALMISAPFYIAAFSIGIQFGTLGVAIAFSTISLLVRIPNIWYAINPSPVNLVDISNCMIPPLISSLIALGLAWLCNYLPIELVLAKLAAKGFVFAIAYLVALLAWENGRDFFNIAQAQLRKIFHSFTSK
ncbi:MAG: lipopolysaccharide biosynthesis protein [Planctomycetota bacterium]